MSRGTPWNRRMVNEQLQRMVAEVLAQLSNGQTAAAAASVSPGMTPPPAL